LLSSLVNGTVSGWRLTGGVATKARSDCDEHAGDDGGHEDVPERQVLDPGHCGFRNEGAKSVGGYCYCCELSCRE
jgi:hypothetical protein